MPANRVRQYRRSSPFFVFERLAAYDLEDVDRLVEWSEQSRRNREERLTRVKDSERYVDDRGEIDAFVELYAECAVVALWRCVEMFRKRLIGQTLGPTGANAAHRHRVFSHVLKQKGISESRLRCARSVDELRCLNNAVKHEGRVAGELARLPRWKARLGQELGDLRPHYIRLRPFAEHYIRDLAKKGTVWWKKGYTMTPALNPGEEDTIWVKTYAKEVCNVFGAIFSGAKDRFADGPKLIERFDAAIAEVLREGRSKFRAVDEAHNELCIAAALLQNPKPKFVDLEYEVPLQGCAKTIDFRAKTAEGAILFVDVKTIKPMPKDRWEQFEKALKEGWLPANVTFLLSKEWLGGELWHSAFAARSRMLEYTHELEQKIADCKLKADQTSFVLALCGEGFHWEQDELEDFVSYYFTGEHRSDDPFSKAEDKYIHEKGINLSRAISRFACLRRPQGDVHARRLNWNVQPPCDPVY